MEVSSIYSYSDDFQSFFYHLDRLELTDYDYKESLPDQFSAREDEKRAKAEDPQPVL